MGHEPSESAQRTKPSHIKPLGGTIENTDFGTRAKEAAAEEILEHWDETHNLAEIARRSGWSHSHIRKVFHEFFVGADEVEEETARTDTGVPENLPENPRNAYLLGYFHGSKDERE